MSLGAKQLYDAYKKLELLVIHYSETRVGQFFEGKDIKKWHKQRGWSRPGYSDIIRTDGVLENLRSYNDDNIVQDNEITWGAKGINNISRHICIIGGYGCVKDKNITVWVNQRQIKKLISYVYDFIDKHPEAKIIGHYKVSEKQCPGFNVEQFLKSIGLENKIFK